jgi:hypothetical protein
MPAFTFTDPEMTALVAYIGKLRAPAGQSAKTVNLRLTNGKTIDGAGGWGGVLSTAGGIVFFCDESGALAAADAKSGKLLWHFYINQP